MNLIELIVNKVLIFEKEPQKIGLSQLKYNNNHIEHNNGASLKEKNVKLSDLMRRAGWILIPLANSFKLY